MPGSLQVRSPRAASAPARRAVRQATPHHFRHAKASLLLNRGADVSEVQDILGHASPKTTEKVYAHHTVSRLREAFNTYSRTVDELAAEVVGCPDRIPR